MEKQIISKIKILGILTGVLLISICWYLKNLRVNYISKIDTLIEVSTEEENLEKKEFLKKLEKENPILVSELYYELKNK